MKNLKQIKMNKSFFITYLPLDFDPEGFLIDIRGDF
jgi:hypothetical protein